MSNWPSFRFERDFLLKNLNYKNWKSHAYMYFNSSYIFILHNKVNNKLKLILSFTIYYMISII